MRNPRLTVVPPNTSHHQRRCTGGYRSAAEAHTEDASFCDRCGLRVCSDCRREIINGSDLWCIGCESRIPEYDPDEFPDHQFQSVATECRAIEVVDGRSLTKRDVIDVLRAWQHVPSADHIARARTEIARQQSRHEPIASDWVSPSPALRLGRLIASIARGPILRVNADTR